MFIKVIIEAKYGTFFFFFFSCVLKKIPPKLNFLTVEGEDRKAILEF